MMSLMPIGRPFNLPAVLSFHLLSASLAWSNASLGSKKIQAPTSISRNSICFKNALTYSSEERLPSVIIFNASLALSLIKSI